MAEGAFPFDPVAVHGSTVTTHLFVKEPTRISRYVSDLVEANLLSQFIFSTAQASGGAILYDQLLTNASTAANKPGVIAPGAEFPLLDALDSEPVVARVQKTGGRYFITDEAVKRNDPSVLQRKAQKVANTMVKDLDDRAFAAISEALKKVDGALEFESAGWAAAGNVKATDKTALTGEGKIIDDIEEAKLLIEETELGYTPDTLVLKPRDAKNLRTILGTDNWQQVLSTLGLQLLVTNSHQISAGEGLLLQRGVAGVMGVESPISTETWRDPARQVQNFSTWATMAYGVTDPLSIVRLKGLAK